MTTNNVSSSSSGGAGVLGLLGIAFIVLKLTHVIDWSWWWVVAPFWGPFLVVGVIVAVALLVFGLKEIFGKKKTSRSAYTPTKRLP